MRIDVALKLIIALLTVMILSVAMILILMNYDDKNPGGEGTTTPESTTTELAPPATTTPEITTTPEVTTTPETSTPETSVPETSAPETSEEEPTPPETTAPDDGTIPEDFELDETYRSDSGTKLNIKAVLHAESNGNGGVKVSVKVYLEHYSIGLGTRSGCQFELGSVKKTFSTGKITQDHDNSLGSTLLYTYEGDFEYGEELDLFVSFPCNCKYGGVKIDTLVISDTVTLK